jgi:hypothetical protein
VIYHPKVALIRPGSLLKYHPMIRQPAQDLSPTVICLLEDHLLHYLLIRQHSGMDVLSRNRLHDTNMHQINNSRRSPGSLSSCGYFIANKRYLRLIFRSWIVFVVHYWSRRGATSTNYIFFSLSTLNEQRPLLTRCLLGRWITVYSARTRHWPVENRAPKLPQVVQRRLLQRRTRAWRRRRCGRVAARGDESRQMVCLWWLLGGGAGLSSRDK